MSKAFSEIIKSDCITDIEAGFNQFNHREDIYIKNDGHWNQKGADLFAETMYQDLPRWIKEKKLVKN